MYRHVCLRENQRNNFIYYNKFLFLIKGWESVSLENKKKIYLAGSFHGYRDEIIKALPNHSFSDPRKHRQSSVAKLVVDDMTEAETCPVLFGYFPKGKSRGTMTYAEIGASVAKNNYIIIVDEDDNPDYLLENIADKHFKSFDKGLEFLSENNIPKKETNNISKKESSLCKKVYLCGSIDHGLKRIVDIAKSAGSKKEYIFKSEDTAKDFDSIGTYDLIIPHFPSHMERDRHACFFMGAAWPHDISVLLIDENEPWKYPPLQGLARRHSNLLGALDYILNVEDLDIKKEAVNMYEFFKGFKS